MISRVLLCVGEKARTPFYIDKLYLNIYSAEELCFVIHENAFMIDRDVITGKLVDWIAAELRLPELAGKLYPMINQNASVSAMVGTIFDYVGYYSAEETEKTENILKDSVSMSVFERWKAKADFLCESGHYALALKEYDYVLTRMNDNDYDLKSRIYTNMGITYVALKLFEFAEDCFEKAFSVSDNPVAYKYFLVSKRMHLSDDEYVRFIADYDKYPDVNVSTETEILNIYKAFDESEEASELKALFATKSSADAQDYYDRIGLITEELKSDYREAVKDTFWRND